MQIAYLISQMPKLSHAFIQREIDVLADAGVTVAVASINDPDRRLEQLTGPERQLAERAYYVKGHGLGGALMAHLWALVTRPAGWLRGLLAALRVAGPDAKRCLWQLFYFTEATMLARWMARRQLRHLHIHFASSAASVGLPLNRGYGISYSLTVHGPDEFYDAGAHSLREKFHAARFIVAISEFARSQILLHLPAAEWGKVTVARLGVDPALFQPRPQPAHDYFEILCVGRLCEAKAQAVLIAAVAELRRRTRLSLRLRLVGAGPAEDSLRTEVARHGLDNVVAFEGGVGQDRIRDFYREADCFVLPSFAEGIPVVLMEAMAMEIPVVATWITGIPELIRSPEEGTLVPPGDALALCDAIQEILNDDQRARRMGRAARRRIEEQYQLRKSVLRLADIFRREGALA